MASTDTVRLAIGDHEQLLVTELDITDAQSAERAVAAAIDRFGRIDVLVNNAGNFFGGFFEELSPQQVRGQIETNLFGPMTVTRAVLPFMRKQRSGLVISISSTAGVVGGAFASPYGIRTMIVEPGFFRTELLQPESTTFAELSIDDYAERTAETIPAWQTMNGVRRGDGPHRGRRAEGQAPARAGRRAPRAVDQARPRRRLRRRLTGTRPMQITNSRRPLCVEQ